MELNKFQMFENKSPDAFKKNKLHFDTNHKLLMFFQTTIRNVALTTAVSLATLGYSRFYREKNTYYTTILVLASLLVISCSSVINYNLYETIVDHYSTDSKLDGANKYLIVTQIFMVIQFILIHLAAYTLFKLLRNRVFK
tara:strand:+ start:20659 stop:21078 length:420 start_codon:yes stop_codon:yes gene_type:complete